MDRKSHTLEYLFPRVSITSLWRKISTEVGLDSWILGQVSINREKRVQFIWEDGDVAFAQMEILVPNQRVRFSWLPANGGFFELEIMQSELTGDKLLRITDHCKPEDWEEYTQIWENQMQRLRKQLGLG